MAESIAILGVVASIVQFVDFGIRLLTKTQNMYRSADGLLKEHVEISEITDDVKKLTGQILTSSTDYGQIVNENFKNLVKTCEDLSNKLLHLLKKLRRKEGKAKTWQSVKASFNSIRRVQEVQNIYKRLWGVREQICFHLTVMLRYRITYRE